MRRQSVTSLFFLSIVTTHIYFPLFSKFFPYVLLTPSYTLKTKKVRTLGPMIKDTLAKEAELMRFFDAMGAAQKELLKNVPGLSGVFVAFHLGKALLTTKRNNILSVSIGGLELSLLALENRVPKVEEYRATLLDKERVDKELVANKEFGMITVLMNTVREAGATC